MGFDSVEELRAWIVTRIARLTGVAENSVDTAERLHRLGLDSLRVTQMLAELGKELGRVLSPTLAWQHPTPDALARHIVRGEEPREARPSAGVRRTDDEPVAIVGLACRLPGAPSPEAFFALLRDGVDAIREVPSDRWSLDDHYDADPSVPGKTSTRWGGFLDDVASFDAAFFGIPPREAAQIDPQQRLALELSWEALEDAGIAPTSLKDTRTGVFFGAMWSDYAKLAVPNADAIAPHTATGQDLSIVPARVSYTLGLAGPSLAVNTACSSSLVAIHLACQSLLRGECRAALAGGVNLMLSPESTVAMSKFGAMAPDGRSKAFDARANGYVRGEGGGVIVLKRLSDALADGDHVYCVVRGSAMNNDGFSNGLTAPSPRAQEGVLADACAAAGVEPGDLQYVEAHGTGTMLGDPIEAGALGAVLGVNRPEGSPLRLGSVKTNIGHLEAAAGIAGLLKVVLAMKHGSFVPNLHFERPNPHIAFDALGLRVQTEVAPWTPENGRLLAGVSSFGFGGTNCHVIVEKTIGAASHEAPAAAIVEPPVAPVAPVAKSVAFVFGGQGSQWAGMGTSLLRDPVGREALTRCDRAFRAYVDWSLLRRLRVPTAAHFEDVAFVQPAIFAMQVAIAAIWQARGVVPSAVVGQSMGEVAAAHVAGILDLDDAARIICVRSRIVGASNAGGRMAVVALGEEDAARAIAPYEGRLGVCVSTSPSSTVVGGDAADVEALVAALAEAGTFARLVRVDYASHSPRMDPLLPALVDALRPVAPRAGTIPFVSTVTAAALDGTTADATYWAKNLREPVRLAAAIARLAREGFDAFVEVDPHAVVDQNVAECVAHAGGAAIVVASAQRDEPELEGLAAAGTKLRTAGFTVATVSSRTDRPTIVPLSAKSADALASQAARLRAHVEANVDLALADVAFSAATTRGELAHRAALVVGSREELLAALGAVTPSPALRGGDAPKVAFVFAGQGAQTPGMGKALHAAEPVFRDAFDRAVLAFEHTLGIALRASMWAKPGTAEAALLDDTLYTQPALFAFESALAALLSSWGIAPSVVVGHSIGELVAAYVTGVLSFDDAIALVSARARGMSALPRGGAMVAVSASEAEVRASLPDSVAIAAVNGATSVTIAGPEAAVLAVADRLGARGIRTKRLAVSHAFHSALMDPMLGAFAEAAASVAYAVAKTAFVSNLTGALASAELADPTYWLRHVRGTVRFADGVTTAATRATVLLEIGPRATLLGLLEGEGRTAIAAVQKPADEAAAVLDALGRAWAAGVSVDWSGVFAAGGARVALPTYAWDRQRHWADRAAKDGTKHEDAAKVLERLVASGELSASAAAAVPELLTALSKPKLHEVPDAPIEAILHDLAWRRVDASVRPVRIDGRWLIVGSSPDARVLEGAIARAGGSASVVDALDPSSHVARSPLDHDVATTEAVVSKARGVLVLADALDDAAVLATMKALATRGIRGTFVTRGAVGTSSDDPPAAPEKAAIWGLGRAFALEHPQAFGGLVDLAVGALDQHAADDVLRVATGALPEDQIALRGGMKFAARLTPGALASKLPALRPRGPVLVTGGLGGLGLHVARWLARGGVKRLVLTSRRGVDAPGAAKAVAELASLGAEVDVVRADVADRDAMRTAIDALDAPLAAVFHVAGIADKTPLAELGADHLAEVIAAKREGTRVIEELTRGLTLDAFVCFSSIAGIWGAGKQAAYSASNACLDAWALAARARGIPAYAIAWGPWDGGGMADASFRAQLARRGLRAMAPTRALEALGRVLRSGAPNAIVADIDWPAFRQSFEANGEKPLLRELVKPVALEVPVATTATVTLRETLATLPSPERATRLRTWLAAQCNEEMGFATNAPIDPKRGFFDLGLDSLMVVGLRRRIERALDLRVGVTVAFDYPSLDELTAHLLERTGFGALKPARLASPPESTRFIDAASDHDVMAILERELALAEEWITT